MKDCMISRLLKFLFIIYISDKIINIVFLNILITKDPKLSVIMPIYNGEKYINISLSSVMNQKFKDIEIIIVDDNSNDDSLKIIRSYIQKDKRIKLIENKENRRILFSKSLAALNSRGKYIIEIDQDDMFTRDDVFEILYNESEKYGLDILHFNFTFGEGVFDQTKLDNYLEKENIDVQPKLKFYQFKENLYLLWGNLIKADLYKKVIYNLWPIIINYKIIFQEDFLITFFMLIYTKKYEKIKNIFYFHFIHEKSASNGFFNIRKLYKIIFSYQINR